MPWSDEVKQATIKRAAATSGKPGLGKKTLVRRDVEREDLMKVERSKKEDNLP